MAPRPAAPVGGVLAGELPAPRLALDAQVDAGKVSLEMSEAEINIFTGD